MDKPKADSNDFATNIKKSSVHNLYWAAAWVATTAVAAFGPRLIWNFATLPTILGVLINLGVGFGMIVSTNRHIQGLDELGQKIFLDAAAFTLGVGLVCGLSYELLEDIRLISFEPEIGHLIILMGLTFMAGMIAGHRKYR
jgi:hypothetical protein